MTDRGHAVTLLGMGQRVAQGTRRLAIARLDRPSVPRSGTTRAPVKRAGLEAALGQVDALREAVELLERQLHVAAVCAREQGATWAALGGALGMTPKSAWKRYVA